MGYLYFKGSNNVLYNWSTQHSLWESITCVHDKQSDRAC